MTGRYRMRLRSLGNETLSHLFHLQAKHAEVEEQLQQAEAKNVELAASCASLEGEAAARLEQLQQLEAELARSAEEVEQAENVKSDLKETLSHVTERRNSLGMYVARGADPIPFLAGSLDPANQNF